MKLLRNAWMHEADRFAIEAVGIPSVVLMENAARAAVRIIADRFPRNKYSRILIMAGKGNNGGDGLAAGRILSGYGYLVEYAVFASPGSLNHDPAINLQILENLQENVSFISDIHEFSAMLGHCDPQGTVLVDALLGTGIRKPVTSGLFAEAIQAVNRSLLPVAAIDIPSGLGEDFPPEAGMIIHADITITFQCPKLALINPDGNGLCGDIHVVDIGIPGKVLDKEDYYMDFIDPASFGSVLAPRKAWAHKGNYGHTLVIGGSADKPGAAVLAGMGVLKSGGGLSSIAGFPSSPGTAGMKYPELMSRSYANVSELCADLKNFRCVAAGPGLGTSEKIYDLIRRVLHECPVPLILDADALNVMAAQPDWLKQKRKAPLALTPHPREFARLTGCSMDHVLNNRIDCARTFAQANGIYVILKGHYTVLATPAGKIYINRTGNPGMATAGSGDVLTGVLAGLVSQHAINTEFEKILSAGIFLHGLAGDLGSEQVGAPGLTATDILNYIPQAFGAAHGCKLIFELTR